MILKSYEINKINLNKNKIILLYGRNDGLKNETINTLIKRESNNISKFDEKDILSNLDTFEESVRSKSLFEEEKIIIINRSTDKSLQIIKELQKKKR